MKEVFKDIKGYKGIYQISNLGRVKSFPKEVYNKKNIYFTKEKILKQGTNTNGYFVVKLYKNKTKHTHRVHRLIAQAFIPNPENKKTINHKNGIKDDNSILNLEWNTYKENIDHAIKNKLIRHVVGEKHGRSKLTEKQVIKIKEELKNPKHGMCAELGRMYNVAKGTIRAIKTGLTWGWLA